MHRRMPLPLSDSKRSGETSVRPMAEGGFRAAGEFSRGSTVWGGIPAGAPRGTARLRTIPDHGPDRPRRPRFDGKTPASWQQSTGLVIPPSASLDVSRTRAGETPSIALGKPEAPQPGPRQNCQTG